MTRLIDEVVAHVLDTECARFGDDALDAAKRRVIDVLGCAVGGANGSGNAAMLDLIRSWGGSAQASVLAHGDKVPLPHAALMNSLMARSFDFEVTGPEPEGANAGKMTGHVPSTTEPVALAVGEYRGASGSEVLAAVILGGDLAARVAVADEFNFEKCFEVCGTANAFGATAVAGRLLGLTHRELVGAFGLLVNQVAGTFQNIWDGVDSFKLPGAFAARNGIVSVQLAQRGFAGVHDAFSSPRGYFSQYCWSPRPENLLEDLGKVFYVKGQHKLHPSCYGNHNAIECGLEILRQHDLDPSLIEAVALEVPPNRIKHFLNQPFSKGDPQPRSLFNLPYAIANVLLRKGVEIEHYTEEFIQDPDVLALAARVSLVPALPPGKNHAGRLVVRLKDGRELSAYREDPKGWRDSPTSLADIEAKFLKNVEHSGTVALRNAERALTLLENLEQVGDVRDVVKLLVR